MNHSSSAMGKYWGSIGMISIIILSMQVLGTSCQGAYLTLYDNHHTQHVIANNTAIREDTIQESYIILNCHTDLTTCCTNQGDWYYSNGTLIPERSPSLEGGYFRTRDSQFISLRRKPNDRYDSTGVICCVIPVQGGATQKLCVHMVPDCGVPPPIEYGSYQLFELTSAMVTYCCTATVSPRSANVSCQSNGTWEDPPIQMCPAPDIDAYLTYNDDVDSGYVISNNSAITYKTLINEDYHIGCHTNLLTCCRRVDSYSLQKGQGEWHFSNGTLVPGNFMLPPSFNGGYYRTRGSQIVSLRRRPIERYDMTESFCCVIPVQDGTNQTLCVTLVPDCGIPPNIEHGSYQLFELTSALATYQCDPGHNMTGSSNISCQHNGTWEDSPRCTDVSFRRFGNRFIANNSIIYHNEFESGEELICATDNTTGCCRLHNSFTPDAIIGLAPSGIGSWLYPNGSYVRPVLTSDIFIITRRPGEVKLRKNRNGIAPSGLWTCVLPDNVGRQQTLNIWFYHQNMEGRITIVEDIQFNLLSLTPLKYELKCITTGGPATRVYWTKNNNQLSPVTSNITLSQTITNEQFATYVNVLTVIQHRIPGRYNFFVSNRQRQSLGPLLSTFNAQGVAIIHDGHVVSNNTIIPTINLIAVPVLLCVTESLTCCESDVSTGNWIDPNGRYVDDSKVDKGTGLVRLSTSQVESDDLIGIWRCEIPDGAQLLRTILVGVFFEHGVSISRDVQFSFVTEEPPIFLLTCITTGSIASNVTWLREGGVLTNNQHYRMSQAITNYKTATYKNTLEVVGHYPGVYTFIVFTSTGVALNSSYTISAPFPPGNLSVELVGVDGILVRWSAPTSGPQVIKYRIYYEVDENQSSENISATMTATQSKVLSGLQYNKTYLISIVGFAPFPSSVVGPEKIKIGIPDPVSSLVSQSFVSAIMVSWNPPLEHHGDITHYEIRFMEKEGAEQIVSTENHTLFFTGLPPGTSYTISVRPFTTAGSGERSVIDVTTQSLGVVSNLHIETVLNVSTVKLSWDPVSFQNQKLAWYTFHYSAYSHRLKKVTDSIHLQIKHDETSTIFSAKDLTIGLEHRFQISFSIHVMGVKFESNKTMEFKFVFDEVPLQLQIFPVDYCIHWSHEKTAQMRHNIHIELTQTISELCNCSFSQSFIKTGKFRCWNSPNEVTYRTTIVGNSQVNASTLVSYVEKWVESGPALQVGDLELKVETKCPVRLSSLKDPECQSSEGQNNDPGMMQCVQSCLCTTT